MLHESIVLFSGHQEQLRFLGSASFALNSPIQPRQEARKEPQAMSEDEGEEENKGDQNESDDDDDEEGDGDNAMDGDDNVQMTPPSSLCSQQSVQSLRLCVRD